MKHITLIYGSTAAKLACNIITEQVKSDKIKTVRISAYPKAEALELLTQDILGKGHTVYAFLDRREEDLITALNEYGFSKLKIVHNPHEYFESITECKIDVPEYMHSVFKSESDVYVLLDFFDNYRTQFAKSHDITRGILLLPAIREFRNLSVEREQARHIGNAPSSMIKDTLVHFLMCTKSIYKEVSLARHHKKLGGNDVAYVLITRNYVLVDLSYVADESKAAELLEYFNSVYAFRDEDRRPSIAKASVRGNHTYKRNDQLNERIASHLRNCITDMLV
jgi:flavodoxin